LYQPSVDWNKAAIPAPQEDAITMKVRGYEFLKSLELLLQEKPDFFASYTTRDIVNILRNCHRCNLDESENLRQGVLLKLYQAYDLRSNHAFRAWDMDKRIELMLAIQKIPDLESRLASDRFATLVRLHELHAEIYGFEPDTVKECYKPARRPEITLKDGEKALGYTISHGSRCRSTDTIYINTFFPEQPNIPSKFHWADVSAVAGLIFHEGRHAHQTKMAHNQELMQYDEFRDIAAIMDLSTYGHYYLRDNHNIYLQNPCEKDAYDFQHDLQNFIKASPEMRKTLIFEMEQRRDAHLKLIPHIAGPVYLPQLAAA